MHFTGKLVSAVCVALTSATAWAHHSFAMFDATKDVTLDGTIKDIQWVNPHSWIQLIAKDSTNTDVEWSIETGGPAELYRAGWRKSQIKPGDKISILMHPLRDGRPGGSLVSATLADGTKLEVRGPGGPPQGQGAINGVPAGSQPAAPAP